MDYAALSHLLLGAVEMAAGIAVVYVGGRVATLKLWFREEMVGIIKENCAGKAEFDAHAKADDVFQSNMTLKVNEIHSASMTRELIQAKLENVTGRMGDIERRIEELRFRTNR